MKSNKGWHVRRFTKSNGYRTVGTYTTHAKALWGQFLYGMFRPWAETDIRYY